MLFGKKSKTTDVKGGFQPGITPRSLFASLLGMLLAGMYLQYSMVIVGEVYTITESAIPIPAMIVLLFLVLFIGIIGSLFKFRLLTKPEIVCVAFTMLLAVPMMTQGFWHRFLGVTSAPLRNSSFDYIDAYSDNLWPHGPNMLKDSFGVHVAEGDVSPVNRHGVSVSSVGKGVSWSDVEYEEGVTDCLPTISNDTAEAVSYLTFTIPVEPGERDSLVPSNPHFVSVLAHATRVETETEIFCRAFSDSSEVPANLFTERRADKPTFLHKKGFVRIGGYGVILSSSPCHSNLIVQLGLRGRGSVTFADPKLMSVFALEAAFRGRKVISESAYNALPPLERPVGVVVKPDNLWSLKGLTYFIKGYIPLREWARPALVWGSYMLILCAAFFCINVIMRKKWAESERYPMPNTRIPLAIIGAEDKKDSPFSKIWTNRYVWAGFVFALLYSLIKGWHFYNDKIPDIAVNINLGEYVTNPVFGGAFNVSFVFSLFVCSIAVFFELNVLLSLVIGYWVFRFSYTLGHLGGVDVNAGYPWADAQMVGSYIGYFLVVMALSSKYILNVVRDALKGKKREPGDVFSSRTAVVIFLLCHVGVCFWAKVAGASVLSMLAMFCFLVMVGFVSAKYRAECGSPFGYFTPYNSMVFVALCGGIAVFGSSGMLVALILSGFLTVTVFYLIPGMQFEVIQIGKRMRIQPRHIIYTCLLGLFGGLFIGGWVFLSNAYTYGGDNIKFQWAFNGLNWFMNSFRSPLNEATTEWLRSGAADSAVQATGMSWGSRVMIGTGVISVVLTLLRQFFAGFWFHPLGFVLGASNLNAGANWGTLLIAWAIRALVLKIGGARAVRDKMQPFFVGVFVGCVVGIAIFTVINSISAANGSPLFYPDMP